MNNKLSNIRRKIDDINLEILGLINKRAELAKEVIKLKEVS